MATTALHPAAPTYRSTLYEWVTTTDHKKIGIMYLINSFIFFFIGGLLALGVRTELAQPGLQFVTGPDLQRAVHDARHVHDLPVHHPDPGGLRELHRAAPDRRARRRVPAHQRPVALDAADGRHPAAAELLRRAVRRPPGWTSYARSPRTGRSGRSAQGRTCGSSQWSSIGTSSILGAVNFLVTIFKMRAPGMTLFRMPIMVWTVLVTSVLGLLATPVLTSALIMLFIDRNYGGSFFDPRNGGDAILYQNIFWFYSHPAVYIMVLPAMGMISEILPVFSRKPLFGYKAFVFATAGIGALGLLGVGPPHVHDRGGLPAVLQPHDVPDRRADRREDVQLDLHDVARQAEPLDAAAVRARLPEHVPHRRHQRRVLSAPCRSTSPCTTRTGSSPTCTTCCSAARCSA